MLIDPKKSWNKWEKLLEILSTYNSFPKAPLKICCWWYPLITLEIPLNFLIWDEGTLKTVLSCIKMCTLKTFQFEHEEICNFNILLLKSSSSLVVHSRVTKRAREITGLLVWRNDVCSLIYKKIKESYCCPAIPIVKIRCPEKST